MGPSLKECLCHDDVQIQFILKGAEAMHCLAQRLDTSTALIGTVEPKYAKQKKRNTPLQQILFVPPETSTNDTNTMTRIAGFFQSITQQPTDDITRTWCVLVMFALFPESRKEVLCSTERRFLPYFEGSERHNLQPFDTRFCEKLCGTSMRQAQTPIEIVVSEWQLFTVLQTQQ